MENENIPKMQHVEHENESQKDGSPRALELDITDTDSQQDVHVIKA